MGLFSFFKKDKSKEKSHLKSLMDMAMADGEIDKFEYEYLLTIATKLGISKAELDALKDGKQDFEYKSPSSKKESFKQLYELICMMMIDGEIHNKEMRMCGVFAKKLGFSPTYIEELVESVKQNVSMGNSQEETLKRVSFIVNH